MRRIDVALGERSYPVLVDEDLLASAGEWLAPLARGARLVVVSDENVAAAQGERLKKGLAHSGIEIDMILVPPGEGSKSWGMLAELVERLAAAGVERSDHVIAFGGGMIGDLTGFATAIFKRGCNYVQIPTSLLAQVDSSVGGKTAINIAAGKNLVGAFHQPALVLIDTMVLETLPARELRAGYAEIVKYGLIGDAAFFEWCEGHGRRLIEGDGKSRLHAIETSVRAKAAIVAEDERETKGRRALLNLGHTFGHALEAETGFSDRLLHGEAVAIGMTLAFHFSAERGLCAFADAERVEQHFRSVGLPTRLSDIDIDAPGKRLTGHMAHDKKMSGGRLPLILTRGIGAAYMEREVAPPEIAAFLDAERDRS